MKKRVKESLVSILIKTANICYNFSIMQYFHPLQKFEVQVCKFFIYIYIYYTAMIFRFLSVKEEHKL